MTETSVQRWDTDRNLALLGYGLLFVAIFFAGITALVAVVLAYAVRDRAGPGVRSHLDGQIRIFWVGLVLTMLAVGTGVAGIVTLVGGAIAQGSDLDMSDFLTTGGFGMATAILVAASAVLWILTALWALITPAIGFIRLATAPSGGVTPGA